MKTQLAKCTKCDIVLIDENPDAQPEKEVPEDAQKMIYTDGGFWACPNCKDDGHLIDY